MNEMDRAIAMGHLILAMQDLGLEKNVQDDLYTAFSSSIDINSTEMAYRAYAEYLITT